jgi:hypothetical protein
MDTPFEELRCVFFDFCRDVGDIDDDDLPQELVAMRDMDEHQFALFLRDKLGKYVGLLDSPSGRRIVWDKLLDGVADTADYFSFLKGLEDDPSDRELFLDFLKTLTAMALVMK